MKYLTIMVAVLVLLINLTGCSGATSPTTTFHSVPGQPIEAVSIRQSGTPNPGGGPIDITVKNVGSEPVIYLAITLKLVYAYTPDFEVVFYDVTPANPLLPGKSITQSKNQYGPNGINRNTLYPLTINGTLESGGEFSYVDQVEFK